MYGTSRKERRNKLIADWAQKIQCHKICAQSEARTQMGSWSSPLKISSQGLFRPSCKFRSHQASARTYFARFICLSPRLSAPGSPRMVYTWLIKRCRVQSVNHERRDTMEFWEDSNHKHATQFHVLSYIDIQDIFIPKKVLEWIWVYYVDVMFMMPENRSKFSRFPENHWVVSFIVYAFHTTTFFQMYVASQRGHSCVLL